MWLLAVLACGTGAPPAGPSARERFVADPPLRTPPAGERLVGAVPWGDPLPFEAVAPRTGGRPAPSAPSDVEVVALENGRWAVGHRGEWSVWDPARGLVAEVTGDGAPTPDGAWLIGASEGRRLRRLDPTPVVGARVAWVRRGGAAYEHAWSEAGAVSARGVSRDAERPAVPVVRSADVKSAVSAADHLVLRTPDGEDTRLDGCVSSDDVSWAPGGGFLACRGDGAIYVHDAGGRPAWSVPETLVPGADTSLSADGRVLVHIVDGGPCVHHAGGGSWTKPRIFAGGAVVTDDGSLVVAVGGGTAVLDAVTGARLDPPRSTLRAVGWAAGPGGELAAITSGGEIHAWDAVGMPLGSMVLPPPAGTGRGAAGMILWDRHVDWTDAGPCASHRGRVVCVDPRSWQMTRERAGGGTGSWGHLVACDPFAVDGVMVPGLRCGARYPKLDRSRRFVEVSRAGERGRAYLDVETLAITSELPTPAPAPLVQESRGGGVRIVDPPVTVTAASPAAPLPRSPTADATIPLSLHLGDLQPPWIGPGDSDPDALVVERDAREIRFRRADGSLGRLIVEGASLVAQAPGYLAVRAGDVVLLASLTDGSVRSVHVGHERFAQADTRGGGGGLVFSPDGSQVAGTGPGVSRVWAVPGLDEVARGSVVARVDPSPEGRWAVVTRQDAGVLLVDLAAGTVAPVDGLRARALDLAFPWVTDGELSARLDGSGGVVASRLLPWRSHAPGLLLDDDGNAQVAWGGRRYMLDDAGRLADVGGHTTDYAWDILYPDAIWEIPGRLRVAPDVRACEPAAGVACSAVPASAQAPASAAGLQAIRPSPDGRWLVGVTGQRRAVLRGPGDRSASLGIDADFAWADARTLVVERDGAREIWRNGVRTDLVAPGPLSGTLAAAGDRVVRVTDRVLLVTPLAGGPPSCVLPVEDVSALAVSPTGRYAAWLTADGLWRADLEECRVVQRPPELAPPTPPPERDIPRARLPNGARPPDRRERLGWRKDSGPLHGSREHQALTRGETDWTEAGAAAWASRGGAVMWRPGDTPRRCALPAAPDGVRWTWDGGVLAWNADTIWTISPGTAAACPPFAG